MKALIISGGTIHSDFAPSFIKKYEPEYIVAADKGLAFCLEQKLKVDMIVGDFDSLGNSLLEEYLTQFAVPVRRFNPVKDATDTEIAIQQVIEAGADQVALVGVTGTRLDHTLGNLQCLHLLLEAGIEGEIVDPYNRITLHEKPFSLKREKQYGNYVSFLPAGEVVENMTLQGFAYPLTNRRVTNRDSLCVSNKITEEEAFVSFTSGKVYMIEARDKA